RSNRDAKYALSKLLQMGTIAKYQKLLRARPTTLGEAFSLARITKAHFKAIAEKEQKIKVKADTTLSLPSEEVSPMVKGPLDANDDILLSLRRLVDKVSSVIDDVFNIGESNVESMQEWDILHPRQRTSEEEKRVKCYVQGSERGKRVLVAAAEGGS
nr:hypothetical protein [Tanacetum cinerariifolium]